MFLLLTNITYFCSVLTAVRNKLVHDPKFNELDNRVEFATSFDSVVQELKAKSKARNSSEDDSCFVM